MAIGTALSTLRDIITQAAPEPMKVELGDLMDSFTVKLGGEPVPGPVFKEGFFAKEEKHEERDSSVNGHAVEQSDGIVAQRSESCCPTP